MQQQKVVILQRKYTQKLCMINRYKKCGYGGYGSITTIRGLIEIVGLQHSMGSFGIGAKGLKLELLLSGHGSEIFVQANDGISLSDLANYQMLSYVSESQ